MSTERETPCMHGHDSPFVECIECARLLRWLDEQDKKAQFTAVLIKRPEPDE